jgi:hypothetical protein
MESLFGDNYLIPKSRTPSNDIFLDKFRGTANIEREKNEVRRDRV